ncbi:hypothetical protein ACFQU9_06830 [Actinomadura namibiensis]|uniref:hypothetical protein n=1 Tax=Actinomadura kijaniata TaxID=46161 RepID=UPI00360627B1
MLYGCGDLIDDYEGITGYEEYRDDLRPLYLASLTPGTGALAELRIAVLRARRMRLERAAPADAGWLADTLRRVGTPVVAEGGTLVLRP